MGGGKNLTAVSAAAQGDGHSQMGDTGSEPSQESSQSKGVVGMAQ